MKSNLSSPPEESRPESIGAPDTTTRPLEFGWGLEWPPDEEELEESHDTMEDKNYPKFAAPIRRIVPIAAILGCMGGVALLVAGEAERQRTATNVRPTHDDLVAKQAQLNPYEHSDLERIEPGSLKPRRIKDVKSILSRSTVLSSGTHWTIVPKRAVVYVPPSYRARVDGKRTGKLIDWATFLQRNRGWVHSVEVTLDQARGKVAIQKETEEAYKRLGRVVVATCQRGPISVNPYKAPEEEAVSTP